MPELLCSMAGTVPSHLHVSSQRLYLLVVELAAAASCNNWEWGKLAPGLCMGTDWAASLPSFSTHIPMAMQAYLEREGAVRANGTWEEPALDKSEADIARHKATQEDVQVSSTAADTTSLH